MRGKQLMIKAGSHEEQIIATWMQTGLGIRQTTVMFNDYRTEVGRVHVGRSCISDTFQRMLPVITKIRKRQQGNKNNEAWTLARKDQTKQTCIMICKITKQNLLDEYGDAPIPFFLIPTTYPRSMDLR